MKALGIWYISMVREPLGTLLEDVHWFKSNIQLGNCWNESSEASVKSEAHIFFAVIVQEMSTAFPYVHVIVRWQKVFGKADEYDSDCMVEMCNRIEGCCAVLRERRLSKLPACGFSQGSSPPSPPISPFLSGHFHLSSLTHSHSSHTHFACQTIFFRVDFFVCRNWICY